MSGRKLAAVRGMNDLLPAESPLWEWFEARVADWVRSYGYQQVRTPILEHTELFVRGIGEVTDIVEKEMYSFEDKLNGENLTLRPEFTAGTVRASVEHNLTYEGPRRVWSMGPVFRHERPQRGRYREFWQCDADIVGVESMLADADVVSIIVEALAAVNMPNAVVHINHRKLLEGIAIYAGVGAEQAGSVFRAIDKLDKVGPEGVIAELEQAGSCKP